MDSKNKQIAAGILLDPAAARLLRVKEGARFLGLSPSYVYGLAEKGRIPGIVRIGNALRLDRRALERWVDEGCPMDGAA